MKKKILLFNFLFFISIALFAQQSQWHSIGLNDSDQLSPGKSDGYRLFSSSSALFATFTDLENANNVVIKRLSDDGKIWQNFRSNVGLPSTAIADVHFYGTENPRLAYIDPLSTNKLIISSFSNNSWSESFSFTATSAISNLSVLELGNFNGAVTFQSNSIIYVKRIEQLSENIIPSFAGTLPRAVSVGTNQYLAYVNNNELKVKIINNGQVTETTVETSQTPSHHQITSVNSEIYIAYKLNNNVVVKRLNGTSWQQISGPVGTGNVISISGLNNDLYIGYQSSINVIKVKKLSAGVWSDVGENHLPYNAGTNFTLKAFQDNLYLAYRELGTLGRVIVKVLKNNNWEDIPNYNAISEGITDKFSVAKASGKIYVAYSNDNDNRKGYVKMYNGSNWVNIGGSYSSGAVLQSSIVASSDGIFVMYGDVDNSGKATVKKLKEDKSGWDLVGNAGFSDNEIELTALTIANSKLYAAYKSKFNTFSGFAFVKTLNLNGGTTWQKAGANDYISGTEYVRDIVLSVDNTNTVYVACSYQASATRVRKLVNNAWVDASSTQTNVSSQNLITSLDLAFDNQNVPYIVYDKGDVGTNNKVTVKKLVNDSWVVVGNDLVSEGVGSNVSITFLNGAPVVSYSNSLNNHKLNVKTWNGSSWQHVGTADFSAGGIIQSHVDFITNDSNTDIFVVYSGLGSVYAKNYGVRTLPVSLTSFEAKQTNKSEVILNWKTASEINNSSFTLYKSKDGNNFEKLGTYLSKGNGANYSVIDYRPFLGTNYYKLQQTDLDGTVTDLGIKSVKISKLNLNVFAVYPNPVTNSTIEILKDDLDGKNTVAIYDLVGKLVMKEELNFVKGRAKLILNAPVNKGMYIIRVDNLTSKIQVK